MTRKILSSGWRFLWGLSCASRQPGQILHTCCGVNFIYNFCEYINQRKVFVLPSPIFQCLVLLQDECVYQWYCKVDYTPNNDLMKRSVDKAASPSVGVQKGVIKIIFSCIQNVFTCWKGSRYKLVCCMCSICAHSWQSSCTCPVEIDKIVKLFMDLLLWHLFTQGLPIVCKAVYSRVRCFWFFLQFYGVYGVWSDESVLILS